MLFPSWLSSLARPPHFANRHGRRRHATLAVAAEFLEDRSLLNAIPIAVLGGQTSINAGDSLTVDGGMSYDPDSGPSALTYTWALNGVSTPAELGWVHVFNWTTLETTHGFAAGNIYGISLTVSDGQDSNSVSGTITVNFAAANQTPIANVSAPSSINFGDTLMLNGGLSSDPDSGPSPLTYAWDLNGDSLADDTNASPSISWATLAGFGYTVGSSIPVTLIVSDGAASSAPVTVNVTVTAGANQAPTAVVFAQPTINFGETRNLFGGMSSDPDNGPSPLTYAWDFNGDSVVDDTTANPIVSWVTLAGFGYGFGSSIPVTLTVNDGSASSAPVTVNVTVAANQVPTAVLFALPTINVGDMLSLFGVMSFDPDNAPSPLTYAWDINGDATTDFTDANPSVSWAILVGYGYGNGSSVPVTLIVSDGSANSAPVTVTINVTNRIPNAVDDQYETEFETPLTIAASGVLANDTDADGDALTALDVVTFVTAPPHNLNPDGSFTFTPPLGFFGTYQFAYRAFDGIGSGIVNGPDVATAMINVKKPVVSLTAPADVAKEVGPVSQEFTLTRTGGTSGPLNVKLSRNEGSADDTDYNSTVIGSVLTVNYAALPTFVTIPAGDSSVRIRITPVMDTSIEGLEELTLTVIDNVPNTYDIGASNTGSVTIRDRAGVLRIDAIGGDIADVPRQAFGLQLTQDDEAVFEAIPTAGGDFRPGEPRWDVNGDNLGSGPTFMHSFDQFAELGFRIDARTPANPTSINFYVSLVPYPVGIASTNIFTPATPANLLPLQYGTIFQHTPDPSLGATPRDLETAKFFGWLDIKEHVEFVGFPPGTPPIDGPMNLSAADATWRDQIFTNTRYFPPGPTGIPLVSGPLSSPQDLLWKSNARDSTNSGIWKEFITDLPITVTVAASSDGWKVTTTDNGVDFVQPFAAFTWNGPFPVGDLVVANIHAPSGTSIPWSTPIPGTLSIVLSGTIKLTAADIAAGFKTFTVTVFDDDSFGDDPLVSVVVTVPTLNGRPNMFTSFRVTSSLINIAHEVAGTLGTSGEQEAQVFFTTPDGTESNVTSIRAL